jgi:hypothetical protein
VSDPQPLHPQAEQAQAPVQQLVQLKPIPVGPGRVALVAIPPDLSPTEALAFIDGFVRELANYAMAVAGNAAKNRLILPS